MVCVDTCVGVGTYPTVRQPSCTSQREYLYVGLGNAVWIQCSLALLAMGEPVQ